LGDHSEYKSTLQNPADLPQYLQKSQFRLTITSTPTDRC
jgi:hypothetical protein